MNPAKGVTFVRPYQPQHWVRLLDAPGIGGVAIGPPHLRGGGVNLWRCRPTPMRSPRSSTQPSSRQGPRIPPAARRVHGKRYTRSVGALRWQWSRRVLAPNRSGCVEPDSKWTHSGPAHFAAASIAVQPPCWLDRTCPPSGWLTGEVPQSRPNWRQPSRLSKRMANGLNQIRYGVPSFLHR